MNKEAININYSLMTSCRIKDHRSYACSFPCFVIVCVNELLLIAFSFYMRLMVVVNFIS